ncbi:MAG TPA: hypothetical protein VEJ20_05690 [Candidatus Eremiobacteraceae bacterium]|nr:hypothetical protein [Candidatus Eremiobacteraceae bacterium]
MAQSSNSADGLLAAAQEAAARDGVRGALARYLEAVDALASANRNAEAGAVLAELLTAKTKKKGLFFGKREESPLGKERPAIAKRYADLVRGEPVSETSLDVLGQLALEFPDDVDVRHSNAAALRLAGYLLDSLDEYKHCAQARPDDTDILVALCDLSVQLGRAEEAASMAQTALAKAIAAHNDAVIARLALRLLDYAPDSFETTFEAFATLDGESLARNAESFEAAVAAFRRTVIADTVRRDALVARISAAYVKLLSRDRSNQQWWQSLVAIDPTAADGVRKLLDGVPSTAKPPEIRPVTPPEPAASAPPAPTIVPEPAAPEAAAPVQRSAAAGGLAAFAKRKAMELFANSEYAAASSQLERVVRMSPDVESLEMLLECYLALDRHDQAARVGVQLAEAELAAGNKPGAIARLTTLSKKIADPTVEQRRVDLMRNA